MPERILNQIKYLCNKIAKVEWSGILFYSVEGSIQDPTNMIINLEDILPMHKGSSAYTEYSFTEEVIDYMEANPESENWKMGHIHSHNTMGVFFSGTDWSELEDNAPNHNFYVSLIVNNFMEFCAKVCFIAESQETKEFTFFAKNELGEKYVYGKKNYEVDDKKLIVYDCNIDSPVSDIAISPGFSKSVDTIIKKADVVVRVPGTVYGGNHAGFVSGGTPGVYYGRTWQARQQEEAAKAKQDAIKNLDKKSEEKAPTGWDFAVKDPRTFNSLALQIGYTDEDDKISEDINDFTMFIVNGGNPIDEFADLDDICTNYEQYFITGDALAVKVLEIYHASYDKWFDKREDKDKPEVFISILEEVITEIEAEIATSVDKDVIEMLEPVCDALKKLSFNTRIEMIREGMNSRTQSFNDDI